MPLWRRIKLNDPLKQFPGFRQEFAVGCLPWTVPLAKGIPRQSDFGLCEFVQSSRIRLDCSPRSLEIVVGLTFFTQPPGQYCGIDRVLALRAQMKFAKQLFRFSFLAGIKPCLYHGVGHMRTSIRMPGIGKSKNKAPLRRTTYWLEILLRHRFPKATSRSLRRRNFWWAAVLHMTRKGIGISHLWSVKAVIMVFESRLKAPRASYGASS